MLALQDVSKRKAIDDAREDARLFKIASELADDEERKRQWRVARGEVGSSLLRMFNAECFVHFLAHDLCWP